MKKLLLTKIRLSWYFVGFFVLFYTLALWLPDKEFKGGVLTLFSVNSFLYGFYISPVLAAQKSRIEELHKLVRTEANAVFNIMLHSKRLPVPLRRKVHTLIERYLSNCTTRRLKAAEANYESLITLCIEYKGAHKDDMDKLLEKLVANQQNRTMLNMQLSNRVYSNEWMIMLVLFSITLMFVLRLDTGGAWTLNIVTALLCTGLTMLMLILLKLSTLTHKKAREIWKPFKTLLDTNYYRMIEDVEEL